MASRDVQTSEFFQRKVDELVRKYDRITEPNAVLQAILQDPESMRSLVDAIQRQASLVRHRSRNVEDAEITVFDNALMILSNGGHDTQDVGALELYLAEYLGVCTFSPIAHAKQALHDYDILQETVTRATASPSVTDEATPTEEQPQSPEQALKTHVQDNEHSRRLQHILPPRPPPTLEEVRRREQVERLIQMYEKAKAEYSKKDPEDIDISLAKYFRDTSENTLHFLESMTCRTIP